MQHTPMSARAPRCLESKTRSSRNPTCTSIFRREQFQRTGRALARRSHSRLRACRAGLRHVIMPAANEKDLRDIPAEAREKMTFTFVSTMDEVIRLMLHPKLTPMLADSPPR